MSLLFPFLSVSQPARAVWIEILCEFVGVNEVEKSQPARAVWIEIGILYPEVDKSSGHSLRGLCGLKSYGYISPEVSNERHSLRGLCGLKSKP